jgi:hypothetical protein
MGISWGKSNSVNARWVGLTSVVSAADDGVDFMMIIRNQNQAAKWSVADANNKTIAVIHDSNVDVLETP